MEKKIIGYKLKDQSLKQAASVIVNGYTEGMNLVDGINVIAEKQHTDKLQQAGVLDLWFEPVYEETPQYKVGDWVVGYINTSSSIIHYIGRYLSPVEISDYCVLRESYDEAHGRNLGLFDGIARHATEEEIRTRLIAEAKTRGYGCGVKIRTTIEKEEVTISSTEIDFWDIDLQQPITYNNLIVECNDGENRAVVYCDENGWAEILPSTPQIEINGYKAEFFDEYVKFGCAEIGKEVFLSLNEINTLRLHKSNREIESVKIGKGKFTKEQIAEIADHYKNTK